MRILLFAVSFCVWSCVDDPPPLPPVASDGGVESDATPAAPSIADVLECGTVGDAGSLPEGTDLRRVVIDPAIFPDARCNDGTQAVFYVRPADTVAGRNRWVIQLQGGGGCHDANDCAKRWCSIDSHIGMEHMTSRSAPPGITGDGILARRPENPYGDANHVLLRYCSSDNHGGRAEVDVDATHPITNEPVRFHLAFRGRDILDAMIATLRKDGAMVDASMPDLDDGVDVLLAGASAGAGGVIGNADYLGEILRAHHTGSGVLRFTALVDSTFGAPAAGLDWSTSTMCSSRSLCTWEAIMTYFQQMYARETDASCNAMHATDAWMCQDTDHMIHHHVTTPFFIRQGLRDRLLVDNAVDAMATVPGQGLMTEQLATGLMRADLLSLANLRSTAEEAAEITTVPGVFGPPCAKHETLSDNPNTYMASLTTANTTYRMFDLLSNWQAGQGVNAVIYDPTMAFACP